VAIQKRAVDARGPSDRGDGDLLAAGAESLYKRIGSRNMLIHELINLHSTRLTLGFQPLGTWEEPIWAGCLQQLHGVLTAQPHLTQMSQGQTLVAVMSFVSALIDATVREGIPQNVVAECCSSLADLTINDGIGAARKAMDDRSQPHAARMSVEPSETTADAINWILLGVRADANPTPKVRNTL